MKIPLIVLVYSLLITVFSACYSTKFTANNDFAVNKNTLVCVEANYEFSARLERYLLEQGFNLVPYEMAVSKLNAGYEATWDSNSYSSNLEIYKTKEIPAAIFIRIQDKWEGAEFRVLNLQTQRLLGVYTYNDMSMSGPARSFAKELSKYLVK